MKYRLLSLSIAATIIGSGSAIAQNELPPTLTARVQIESKTPLSQVVGLVISSDNATQIRDTRVTKIGSDVYEVVFPVSKTIVDETTVATALGVAQEDQIIFGSMTPNLVTDPSGGRFTIPECPAEEVSPLVSQSQMAPLKSLVDIRTARSDLAKMKVSRLMSDQLIIKLRKFEKAFGLGGASELSSDLPPTELVDRLSRLTFALKQFRAAKAQADSAK